MKVLLVGPEDVFTAILSRMRYSGVALSPVRHASTIPAATDWWRAQYPEVVLLDLRVAALQVSLGIIASFSRRSHVVALAPTREVEVVVATVKAGASDYVEMPCGPGVIEKVIRDAGRPCAHVLAEKLDEGLRNSLGEVALGLGAFSSRFGISASYASKLFREHVGTPFRSRLREHRIREAVDMLTNSDLPVHVVSERCGFRSPARLSEAFRRMLGQAPRRYRSLNRARAIVS